MKIAHTNDAQAGTDMALNIHMEGDVHVQHLFTAEEANGKDVLMVFFSPGGRTHPHIHRQGQLLYITYGTGVVAIEDEQRIVKAGDAVVIPPGAWHWHGATQGTAMNHLVYQAPEREDVIWEVPQRNWAESYSTM